MIQEDSLEAKQTYLRSQIIDSGVDPESFMVFMGAAKGEGQNINLEVWTLPELKKVVQDFKESLEQQLKREQIKQSKLSGQEALMVNRASRKVADRVMGSKLPKKEKVFYERDDLWDYETVDKVQCKKSHRFFSFKVYPEINCKGVQVKKAGGYLFGIIGGKQFIQLTLVSNFSNAPIMRKSQDLDWLRNRLLTQYPGSYVPPLDPSPQFQNEDKVAVAKRAKQIMQFLNSLVHFDHLLHNKYAHMFFTETDYKGFQNFKSKNSENPLPRTVQAFENFDGIISVQISQRIQDLVKNSSKYGKEVINIYKSVEETLGKLNNDFLSMNKHFGILQNDFGKLREKYITVAEKSDFDKIQYDTEFDKKLSAMFGHLKNVFSVLQAHTKKQLYFIRDFNQENIKVMIKEWYEFDVLQNKHKRELEAYLTLKSSLSKRKQQFFLDLSKKQLQQRQKTGTSKQTTLAQKQQMYRLRFPQDSKLEQQKRAYQGYINHMYQKSFLSLLSAHQKQLERKVTKVQPLLIGMLNQRLQIYNGYEKYVEEEVSKLGNEHQHMADNK